MGPGCWGNSFVQVRGMLWVSPNPRGDLVSQWMFWNLLWREGDTRRTYTHTHTKLSPRPQFLDGLFSSPGQKMNHY